MDTNAINETNWSRWNFVENDPKFHQYWFENVDIDSWYSFGEKFTYPLVVLAVILYHGTIWWAKKHMRDREPYKLRSELFFWNVFVGLFSLLALSRLSSEVFAMLNMPQGFYRSICLREGLHMSTAFWGILLAFSKPFFMFDTFFLILRKKPIDASHLIHHTAAIVFTPIILQISEPMLRWVGLANLVVHSIDYPLLALRTLKIPVPKSRQIMAALEIAQMIFVLILSAYTLVLRAKGTACLRHPKSVLIFWIIYIGLLLAILITILSPEYWKRGLKKMKARPEKQD